MRYLTIVVVALVLASVWGMVASDAAAAWMAADVRAVVLALLPLASAACLLLAYFSWRDRWRHRMLGQPGTKQRSDEAA